MARCEGKNKKGGKCGSNARPGSKYCCDHQDQDKNKTLAQSLRGNSKLRRLVPFGILVLFLAGLVYISVSEEKQTHEELFQAPGIRIINSEITGAEPFRAIVNLRFNFTTTNNPSFAFTVECYNPERAMFSVGSCENAIMEVPKLTGNNIINERITLNDKKTKEGQSPALGKPFWFPFDRYRTEVNISGVHLIKSTVTVAGFSYRIVDNWDGLISSIRIDLYRPYSMKIFLLSWWLIITIIGIIFVYKRPQMHKSRSEMIQSTVGYFLPVIAAIFAIRAVSTAPTIPTFLDLLFLASFLICSAITLWPIKD